MGGIGGQELLVIVVIFLFLSIQIGLPLWLQKRYPNRIWLGIILCFICGTAQFYLPKSWKYFFLCVFVFIFLKNIYGDGLLTWIATSFFNAGLMYWRFLKMAGPQKVAITIQQ